MSESASHPNFTLAAFDLLRGLDEPALRMIAQVVTTVSLPAGHVLFRRGERPGAAYMITSGMLSASAVGNQQETHFLTTLGAGESVGGWELLSGDALSLDVVAVKDTNLLCLDSSGLESALNSSVTVRERITTAAIAQMHRWRLLIALHVSQIFGNLEESAVRDLAGEVQLLTFAGGQEIFRFGDAGDSLYVVVTGRVRVLRPIEGGEQRFISELGIGEIFGEMALITGEPRSATVCAFRDTQVACLSRDGYNRFLRHHPNAALAIVGRTMALRLERQTAGVRHPLSLTTLALVPAGTEVPLHHVATRLAETFAPYGRTTHLSSSAVDTALGIPQISQAQESDQHNFRLVEWLGNQETSHKYLIYECDPTLTAWTRRCLRQADHVLCIASAKTDPVIGPIERWLLENDNLITSSTRSLVLLQNDGEPQNSAQWMRRYSVERHFHLRPAAQADWERLARFLLGRALGLTLGGGFARGLVHIGVIRALREAGIEIDAIGGNSMGAMIAAQWALGWNDDTILHKTSAGCARCIRGITIPIVAFKSGQSFSALVESFFESRRIEDLPVPYFCVSANLNRAELKVHTEGPLSKAILASTRVPGLFPPIVYDGELHVDGGVIDNVPVDVMRSVVKSGTVVGVDAVPSRVFGAVRDYGAVLPGWRALWSYLNPFGRSRPSLPNIGLIMLRTIEFGGITHNRSAASSADLYLRPPLQHIKPTDFTIAEQIVEIGYRHACEALERWQSDRVQTNRQPANTSPLLHATLLR